jgi:hypothetical protein
VWIEAGGRYLITAQGQWQLAPVCPVTGPDGVGLYNLVCWDIGGKTVNSGTHAALLGRIGRDGPPFLVGGNVEFTAQQVGALYLIANDHPSWFVDNTGSVSATVRMLDATASAGARSSDNMEIIIRQETSQASGQKSSSTVKIRGGGGGGTSAK